MRLKSNKEISRLIKQHITLFENFNYVYLFGSLLDVNKVPNDIDILHENILKTHNENDTTLLEEQLAELEHACFTKMNLELAAYFKQGFKMGMRLAKELNDEE